MKNKRVFRLLTSLLAVALYTTAFSVTAFAGGGALSLALLILNLSRGKAKKGKKAKK